MQDYGTGVSLEQLIEDQHEAICANNRHLSRLQKEIEELKVLVEAIKEQRTINRTVDGGMLY
jgi:hypothetical protein